MFKKLLAFFTFKILDRNTGEMVKIPRPILKPYDKDRFELASEYEYKGIKIPVGYKTNGANIPRFLWPLFPPNSPEYLSAVVVHDFLCDEAEQIHQGGKRGSTGEAFPSRPLRPPLTPSTLAVALRADFKFADECLKEMMLALGCSRLKTNLFYYACRAWHKVRYGG